MAAAFDSDMIHTGEVMNLGDLERHWADLDRAYRRVRRLPESSRMVRLTARRFDEVQPAGHRVYFAAERYLGVAMDNHWALMSLLEHHGVTPSAPWSLLRPSFECAFLAGWVLDPADGRQRRIRGLRLEVLDEKERLSHTRAFEELPEVAEMIRQSLEDRKKAEAAYRRDAADLGVDWKVVRRKVNLVDELPRLSWIAAEEPLVQATMVAQWRMLSGFEHGLGWAMLRGSNATEEVAIPGGAQMQLTIDDDAFTVAAQCVVWLMRAALARLERLHMDP